MYSQKNQPKILNLKPTFCASLHRFICQINLVFTRSHHIFHTSLKVTLQKREETDTLLFSFIEEAILHIEFLQLLSNIGYFS